MANRNMLGLLVGATAIGAIFYVAKVKASKPPVLPGGATCPSDKMSQADVDALNVAAASSGLMGADNILGRDVQQVIDSFLAKQGCFRVPDGWNLNPGPEATGAGMTFGIVKISKEYPM